VIDATTLALIGIIAVLLWLLWEIRRVYFTVLPIANSTIVRTATAI
jgi:hypothetical protein